MEKSLEIYTKALSEEMANKLAEEMANKLAGGYSEEEVMKIAKEPLDKIDEKKALEEKIIKHAYVTLSKKVVENPRETLNDDEIENAKAALSKDELYEELYDEECEKMLATYKPYTISRELYLRLKKLGIIGCDDRNYNIGSSDYSKHIIQPWSIWIDWNLNPWDADIIKRVLRTKSTDNRIMDYEKIIHVCKERIRQLKTSDK